MFPKSPIKNKNLGLFPKLWVNLAYLRMVGSGLKSG